MKTLLSTTDILHRYLQKADLDMAKALQHKDAVIQTLTEMRCAGVADQIYAEAAEIMMANDIAQPRPGSRRVPKRKKMDDYYTTTSVGQKEEITSADMMPTRLYYPIIGRMLCEMNSRFSPQNNDAMLGVCSCSQSSDTVHIPRDSTTD